MQMPIPPPIMTTRDLPIEPVVTSHLSISPSRSQGVVHSPRPFLSPKHSYSVDPVTHHSLTKSERVEELEKMAAEVGARNKDLSADIPKASSRSSSPQPANIDKTLPTPPVPTGKDKLLSAQGGTRARVDTLFATSDPAPLDKTPPTPTIIPAKLPRHDLAGLGRSESGLDALERRLLAEVGTRKMDMDEKRPDVREVLPITIPQSNKGDEPLNDSAISSLTLADHDSDERTHKAGKSSMSSDDREGHGRSKESGKTRKAHSARGGDGDTERKSGKKKERSKDGDAHRLRKSAKGRVAAWLDGISPDVPPESPTFGIEPVVDTDPHTGPAISPSLVAPPEIKSGDSSEQDVSSAPNPRSSGFVPIGTLKRDGLRRQPAEIEAPSAKATDQGTRKSPPAPSNAKEKPLPFALHSTPVAESPKTDRNVSPPSFQLNTETVDGNGKANGYILKSPHLAKRDPASPSKVLKPSPRLPAFPPPPPEHQVKYDIRSARGGRGGKVASVASIWASGTANDKVDTQSKDVTRKPPKLPARPLRSIPESVVPTNKNPVRPPEPKLVDLAGRRARPIIKSSSVPAAISSSHATPTLSSTASLARPYAISDKSRSPIKLESTIPEGHSEVGKFQIGAKLGATKPSVPGDLAFGQAKLRDLIKKYQGNAT